MKIIDAHLHFVSQNPYFNQIAVAAGYENSLPHLKAEYDRLGIASGIVMGNRGLEPELHQYPEWLSYCIGLDHTCVDVRQSRKLADQLEVHLSKKQCVGIKLYPGYQPVYITDPIYEPVYELAEYYKKPVAVHTGETAGSGAVLKYSHPLTVDEAAAKHPEVRFVMCHFGNPWLNDAAAVMSKNPNVSADLSGLLEGRVNVKELMEEKKGYIDVLRTWLGYFDYQRLMFGTDWPLVNLEEYITFIACLVPSRYHEAVFHENAQRIYGV